VPVDPDTLETSVPGVFAIGDVNVIPIGEGKAIPKAGVFASGQADTVGRLIASRINDQEPPPAYDGQGECFLTFSDSEAALVGGTFLGSDGPRIGLGEASEGAIRLKEEFEQDWRRFVI
jgi:sulfide:quinone oxidoreductase